MTAFHQCFRAKKWYQVRILLYLIATSVYFTHWYIFQYCSKLMQLYFLAHALEM